MPYDSEGIYTRYHNWEEDRENDIDIVTDHADEEDDGLKPVVPEDKGDYEETDTKEDGHSSDDLDEMRNFTSNWSRAHLEAGGEVSNTTHDSAVTSGNHNTTASALHRICGKEGQVLSLQGVLICILRCTRLRL